MGDYPKIQINHASNKDNIYWGYERYVFPLKNVMKLLYRDKRKYYGSDMASQHFWGDLSKKHIKYIRNHCFNGINTMAYDRNMPYRVRGKENYSNYWFSSSDGHTVEEFNALLARDNIDKLEKENGACIVYTHFASGFVHADGEINKEFRDNMVYLSNRGGWFVPAGVLLDYLLVQGSPYASYPYLLRLDFLWLMDRLIKKMRYSR